MTSQDPIIQLFNVTKRYPLANNEYYEALRGVSLTIKKGEFVAIMGPSGSGKSTTMHILGALDTPTSGSYLLHGKDISLYTSDQLAMVRNREIGFVFQSFNLLPRLTVLENVMRPMQYAAIPKLQRVQKAIDALTLVGIADKANNRANHISGGQIQRVAIARAIVMHPSILLADEPTGNLDSKTSEEIMALFKKLHSDGSTVVLITHDQKIASHAKRVIRIIDGKVVS